MRRAYTATPHRIRTPPPHLSPPPALPLPFQPAASTSYFCTTPSPLSFSPSPSPSSSSPPPPSSLSHLLSLTPHPHPPLLPSPRIPPPPHSAFIARQYATTAEGDRREAELRAQLRAVEERGRGGVGWGDVGSSLSTKGGYISHVGGVGSEVGGVGMGGQVGEGRAAAYRPGYWEGKVFVPVCVRGPAAVFGTGREGLDEVGERKRAIREERRRREEKERRRRKQREMEERRRKATGEEEKREGVDEEEEDVEVDFVRANIVAATATSSAERRQKLSQGLADLQRRQERAREERERLQAEVEQRNARLMLRYSAAYTEEKRKEEEATERRGALQRSWLVVVALAARAEWWRAQLLHYQSTMRTERAAKVIVHWLQHCIARRRHRRFLHARRQVRLFFEEKRWVAALLDDEERKRRQLDVVLSWLQSALSRRQLEVVSAFSGLEKKAIVIQRAWRGFLVTSKWRLYVQTLQFLHFDQRAEPDDTHDREDGHSGGSSAAVTNRRSARRESSSRPPSRQTARSSRLPSASPRASVRVRYIRFTSPLVRSSGGSSSDASASLSKWRAMLRLMREVFMERLMQEARLHRVLDRARQMEALREHISRGSDGVISPRFGLASPRTRQVGPSVCRLEWPHTAGQLLLRHVLLTTPQLHELHRRVAKLCAAGVGGGGDSSLEPLYVVAVSGKYRRRDSPAADAQGTKEGEAWRAAGQGGLMPWVQLKRWSRRPILVDGEDVRDAELEREHALLKHRAQLSLVVEADN